MTVQNQNDRIRQGWEELRGQPLVYEAVLPPLFVNHSRFARGFSHAIATFAIRVFHNREENFYADANRAIRENSRYYIEHTDVRDDRDSFYWNISEICRVILRYGTKGDNAPGLVSAETEAIFLEMALGYCRDHSRLTNAEVENRATWRIYESENHHVQKNIALWQLLLILLRYGCGDEIMGDGARAAVHFDAWSTFFKVWMRERAGHSMLVEVHSKGYGESTLRNLFPLHDFAPDEELRRMSGDFITLYWALWAQEQLCGIQGGGQSRVYTHHTVTTYSGQARWAWYYCGIGEHYTPDGSDYTLLDCSYRMPPLIAKMIHHPEMRGTYEVESRPYGKAAPDDNFPDYRLDTEWGHIYRYTYCTPDYILGTQQYPQLNRRQWCNISAQNRYQGATFRETDAMITPIVMPREMTDFYKTTAYNTSWSMMRGSTLLSQCCYNYDGIMRVFFSRSGGIRDSMTEADGWIFAQCGDAYAALRVCRGGYVFEEDRHVPGTWVICEDGRSPIILEMGDRKQYPDRASFEAAVLTHIPRWEGEVLHYTSLSGHDFMMITGRDGESTVDGEYYVKKPDVSLHSPFVNCPWGGDTVQITFGGETMTLSFA